MDEETFTLLLIAKNGKRYVMSMTLQEALKAMQTHRVRHRYFDKEEWVTKCTNGLYYFEDGINFTEEEFLLWADKPYFKEGWEIIPNPERSVG